MIAIGSWKSAIELPRMKKILRLLTLSASTVHIAIPLPHFLVCRLTSIVCKFNSLGENDVWVQERRSSSVLRAQQLITHDLQIAIDHVLLLGIYLRRMLLDLGIPSTDSSSLAMSENE